MPNLQADDSPTIDELVDLYDSVEWSAYTADHASLAQAVDNSTFVVTGRDDAGHLIGLARAISDDVSIVYIQDVLVRPSHQRQGLGQQLIAQVLDRFSHVRQRMLLTDDEPHQHRLYRSIGLTDVADHPTLHAFFGIAAT